VTVIAAGFDGGGPVRRNDDRALGQIAGSTQRPTVTAGSSPPARFGQPAQKVELPVRHDHVPVGAQVSPAHTPNGVAHPATAPAHLQEPLVKPPRTVTFDDNDDLDVPDFLK
jgi:cell division protein FtsZ